MERFLQISSELYFSTLETSQAMIKLPAHPRSDTTVVGLWVSNLEKDLYNLERCGTLRDVPKGIDKALKL